MIFQMNNTLIETIRLHFNSLVGSYGKRGEWTTEDKNKVLNAITTTDVMTYKNSNFLYDKNTDKQLILEVEGIKFHHIKSLNHYIISIDGLFKLIIIDYNDEDQIKSKWSVDYFKGDPAYIGCTNDEVPSIVKLTDEHIDFLNRLRSRLPKVRKGYKYLFRIQFQD